MNKFLELNKPRGERIAALVDMIEPDEIPLPQDTRGQQLSAEAREPARAHVAATIARLNDGGQS